MRKILTVFFILFISAVLSANGKISSNLKAKLSTISDQNQKILIWIYFNDKNPIRKETYQSNPLSYISEKSLNRRSKFLSRDKIVDITDLPVNSSYIEPLKTPGFEIKQKSRWFNAVSGYITAGNVNKIAELPFVKQVDIVGQFKVPQENLIKQVKTSINLKKDITSLNYGNSLTQLNLINVPAVHDMGYTGKGITIGVFDAGFSNLAHEVFSRMHIIAKWDFVNNGPNVGDSVGLQGEGSHGTATLSAIGGFKEGKLIGPAFEADYVLAKTENTDSETPIEEDNWIAAMEWADSIGIDIASTSLGYLVFDKPYTSYTWQDLNGHTARITLAAAMAARKGIVVVVSAGNEGESPDHNTLGAPADADTIITVGAVDSLGIKAGFSSIGPTSDGRIKPDVMAMGVRDYLAGTLATDSYVRSNGTSFSCPLTAGAAALVLSANPKLTPIQVRDALRNTASRKNSPDRYYGWGIVNAVSAVNYALSAITDVKVEGNKIPGDFQLSQNYPNPFNPTTTIKYSVPVQSSLKLELYNVLGVKLSTLFEGTREKGQYTLQLDGSSLPSGIYFVRMSAASYNSTIKLILEK